MLWHLKILQHQHWHTTCCDMSNVFICAVKIRCYNIQITKRQQNTCIYCCLFYSITTRIEDKSYFYLFFNIITQLQVNMFHTSIILSPSQMYNNLPAFCPENFMQQNYNFTSSFWKLFYPKHSIHQTLNFFAPLALGTGNVHCMADVIITHFGNSILFMSRFWQKMKNQKPHDQSGLQEGQIDTLWCILLWNVAYFLCLNYFFHSERE